MESLDELLAPAGQRLLARLASEDLDGPGLSGLIESLRREYPAGLVAAAITQARLRRRARGKFGVAADRMYFTADGLEQATRPDVARHRAARFPDVSVLDLCCGIGGDLLALTGAGIAARGIDVDPATVAVARANLDGRAEVECADVRSYPLAGWQAAFCDPARRAGGRRTFDPDAYSPPFGFLLELAGAVPMTAAKVAPGLPHERIPDGVEAEWVSYRGAVTEAALWFGPLATAHRRATLLPSGATITGGGARIGVGPVGRYLYEPDGAVVRAHLVAEAGERIGARLIDERIAYLTCDERVETPLARGYEVTDVFGFSLKRLRAVLRARNVGSVAIKKRGSALDPAALRRQLRLSGSEECTVVLTRVGNAPTVLLCR